MYVRRVYPREAAGPHVSDAHLQVPSTAISQPRDKHVVFMAGFRYVKPQIAQLHATFTYNFITGRNNWCVFE